MADPPGDGRAARLSELQQRFLQAQQARTSVLLAVTSGTGTGGDAVAAAPTAAPAPAPAPTTAAASERRPHRNGPGPPAPEPETKRSRRDVDGRTHLLAQLGRLHTD